MIEKQTDIKRKAAIRHPWIVTLGSRHFGPFEEEDAVRFAYDEGGAACPLWGLDEVDYLSQHLALDLARAELARAGK